MPTLTLRLKAFDPHRVEAATRALVALARQSGTAFAGPRPLPVKLAWYEPEAPALVGTRPCERQKLPVYQRLMTLQDPTPDTVQALETLALPAGVRIQVSSG